MKKLILATVSISLLAAGAAQADGIAIPAKKPVVGQPVIVAQADENAEGKKLLGGGAGAGVGAAAGAVVGGPVGAIIGGFAGAVIGAETAVPGPAVNYVVANPVEPVAIQGELAAGAVLPETVAVQPIPDYPDYGYVYADGRPVIVDLNAREVVYSPGYVVPDGTVAYVEQNPVTPVPMNGAVTVGSTIPTDVQIVPVPQSPSYGYIYTETGPVLVQANTRTVVWVNG